MNKIKKLLDRWSPWRLREQLRRSYDKKCALLDWAETLLAASPDADETMNSIYFVFWQSEVKRWRIAKREVTKT